MQVQAETKPFLYDQMEESIQDLLKKAFELYKLLKSLSVDEEPLKGKIGQEVKKLGNAIVDLNNNTMFFDESGNFNPHKMQDFFNTSQLTCNEIIEALQNYKLSHQASLKQINQLIKKNNEVQQAKNLCWQHAGASGFWWSAPIWGMAFVLGLPIVAPFLAVGLSSEITRQIPLEQMFSSRYVIRGIKASFYLAEVFCSGLFLASFAIACLALSPLLATAMIIDANRKHEDYIKLGAYETFSTLSEDIVPENIADIKAAPESNINKFFRLTQYNLGKSVAHVKENEIKSAIKRLNA